jgi:REP element-mobilizing transposase RayT
MRNLQFAEGEIYHIYNRGVDKRVIFPTIKDMDRFFDGMSIFNNVNTIGSLDRTTAACRHSVSTEVAEQDKLVKFIAYCLNPNHFHLILEQVAEKGIEKFMHKWEMSHSKYINAKYKRSGALFQGSFKTIHIDSNEYLLHASAYVNLNDRVHKYKHGMFTKSSWDEYLSDKSVVGLCEKNIILEQFKNIGKYKQFAESTLQDIVQRKSLIQELENEGVELVHTR